MSEYGFEAAAGMNGMFINWETSNADDPYVCFDWYLVGGREVYNSFAIGRHTTDKDEEDIPLPKNWLAVDTNAYL